MYVHTRRDIFCCISALGISIGLAGCSFDRNNQSSISIDLAEVPPEGLSLGSPTALHEFPPRAQEMVREGLTNRTIVYGTRPIESGTYIRANGTYYVSQIIENRTTTTDRPILEAMEVSTPDGPMISTSNLTYSDMETLQCAISSRNGTDTDPCLIYGGTDSAFWPEPRSRFFNESENRFYRLRSIRQTVTVDQYTYEFESIARNRSTFDDIVAREQVDIDFSEVNMSQEQRDILANAAENGPYRESPPYSDSLLRLVDRLEAAGADSGGAYIRFNKSYYRVSLRQRWDS